MRSVFVVAPEVAQLFDVDTELAALAENFEILPQPILTGHVTIEDIAHEAAKYMADILLIASEMTGDGIQVTGGHINEEHIAGYVKALGATLLFLSVCDGEQIAKRVFADTKCAVVYCRIAIPDREAALYTARFMRALAQTDDYREAWRLAGNARGKYVLLAVTQMSMERRGNQVDEFSRAISELGRLATVFSEFKDDFAEFKALMKADVAVVREQMRQNERHEETRQKQIEALEQNTRITREQMIEQARNIAILGDRINDLAKHVPLSISGDAVPTATKTIPLVVFYAFGIAVLIISAGILIVLSQGAL